MYAPRVFVSIIGTLAVFAVATYVMSGSFMTALTETAVCAVILQVGYFLGILYLVKREAQQKAAARPSDAAANNSRAETPIREKITADAAARMHIHDR